MAWWVRHRRSLGILVLALAIRLALSAQTIIFPADEMWQYIEPAWGLITGHWIETWEFHAGIRGWLIPMILTPALWLGHVLAPNWPLHLWLLRAMLSLASLGVAAGFHDMGANVSPRHGMVAGVVGDLRPGPPRLQRGHRCCPIGAGHCADLPRQRGLQR